MRSLPSLASPEPWVKSSWYCLMGIEAGNTLAIRGLEETGTTSATTSGTGYYLGVRVYNVWIVCSV